MFLFLNREWLYNQYGICKTIDKINHGTMLKLTHDNYNNLKLNT